MSNKKINEDKTLNKMEKSQLHNSVNNVDIKREFEDCTPDNFSEKQAPHRDERDGDIMRSNPDFEIYSEGSRYCKKLPIDEKKNKEL